jgi:hypothetical protein
MTGVAAAADGSKSKREWALWVCDETVADPIGNVSKEPRAADGAGQVLARTGSFGGMRKIADDVRKGQNGWDCGRGAKDRSRWQTGRRLKVRDATLRNFAPNERQFVRKRSLA